MPQFVSPPASCEQGATLKIKSARPAQRTIHVRIPRWTTEDAQVKINGRPLDAMADPGSYLALRKVWQDGDTITVSLPMELWQEPLPGDASITAALYGPLVLAADLGAGPSDKPNRVIHSGDTSPKNLPAASPLPKVAATPDTNTKQWIQVESLSEPRFTAVGESSKYQLMPMYQIGDQRYSVYWQMQSPKKQS